MGEGVGKLLLPNMLRSPCGPRRIRQLTHLEIGVGVGREEKKTEMEIEEGGKETRKGLLRKRPSRYLTLIFLFHFQAFLNKQR